MPASTYEVGCQCSVDANGTDTSFTIDLLKAPIQLGTGNLSAHFDLTKPAPVSAVGLGGASATLSADGTQVTLTYSTAPSGITALAFQLFYTLP